jgi:hypothetical protein
LLGNHRWHLHCSKLSNLLDHLATKIILDDLCDWRQALQSDQRGMVNTKNGILELLIIFEVVDSNANGRMSLRSMARPWICAAWSQRSSRPPEFTCHPKRWDNI